MSFHHHYDTNSLGTVANFLKNIENSLKLNTSQKIVVINAYYLPDFADKLIKISLLCPLWTNIIIPVFYCPNITAASAPVESEFNH